MRVHLALIGAVAVALATGPAMALDPSKGSSPTFNEPTVSRLITKGTGSTRSFSGAATLDSRAFTDTGLSTGPYTDFDSKADGKETFTNTEAISPMLGGAIRDQRLFQFLDRDVTNYGALSYRVISNALRVVTSGRNDGNGYVAQWKDLHGLWSTSVGNSGGVTRGVSGVLGEAIQFGTGVATNEFSAMAPVGAPARPALIAPVIGIVYAYNGDADGTHLAYGLQANLYGYRSTAAFRAASVSALGQPGAATTGIRLDELAVTGAAMTMPQVIGGGTAKGLLDYGAASTYFDTAANAFVWKIGATEVARIDGGAWPSWSPTLACSTGSLASATSTGSYKQIGKTITFSLQVSVTTNGSCAGFITATLPVPASATGGMRFAGTGYEDATSGAALSVRVSGTTLRLTSGNNLYPAADGAVLVASGTYQAQ